MNFDFTEEQTMVKETLSRFLRDQYSFESRQAILNSEQGWSPEIWAKMAEMGIIAAAFPEEYGGFGGTAIDLMVLMEEFGRAITVEPFLPTVVLCGGVLRTLGGEAAEQLIPQIAEGSLIMGLGYAETRSRFCLSHVETEASKEGDGYRLNGRKSVVLAAPIAQKLIVSARTSGEARDESGISLFLIDTSAEGVSIESYKTIDGLPAGEVVLNNVTAEALLGQEGQGYVVLESVIDQAIIAISAEAAGLCRTMLDLTKDYCQTRQQFGQPISQFQVLQHRMVDMFIYAEEMTSMAYMAAMKSESDDFDTRLAASSAKVQLGKSCKTIGESAIQLHGGMGITEEMSVGHYFMHATMLELLFGNTEHHLSRYQALASI